MNKPELLIFDWDGTVVDSTQTIVRAIQSACRDIEIPIPDAERCSYVIGLGLADALGHVAPGLSPAQAQLLGARFRVHYLTQDHCLALFPGMQTLLQALVEQGIVLGVATGKSRAGLDRAFNATDTRRYFADSRCADESEPKPSPKMVFELCELLGVDPGRSLVIGDTTHDLGMARAAGAGVVSVSYGAHPAEQLRAASPDHLVDSVADLAAVLEARLGLTAGSLAGPASFPHHP